MFKSGLFVIILLMGGIEFYIFRALKANGYSRRVRLANVLLTLAVLSFLVFNFLTFDRNVGQTPQLMWSVGLFMLLIIPKFIFVFFFLLEDFSRMIIYLFSKIFIRKDDKNIKISGRRKFVVRTAMVLASIPFLGLLHGMAFGRYNYKVIRKKLSFARLPKAFEGLRILHITDIHSGSLDNRDKIQGAVDMINEQEYDLLLFTGDIVNNFHWEMDEWITIFNQIRKAPLGNYAVLGNHDYGEYSDWKSEEAKAENFLKIKEIFPKIGFQLLLNEHLILNRDGQSIALVGVENWGANFQQKGDLNLASEGLKVDDFKILMTHDPSHWEHRVKADPRHFDLTLSGHTHGMQLGIEVPSLGIKWSPSKYVYAQWAGFYTYNDRVINVNRGFGYHFFPGRVGIWPEITVIELTKE